MELPLAKVSTGFEYPANMEDNKYYYIEIRFPIPGGAAIYKIPTTSSINNSIDQASKLK